MWVEEKEHTGLETQALGLPKLSSSPPGTLGWNQPPEGVSPAMEPLNISLLQSLAALGWWVAVGINALRLLLRSLSLRQTFIESIVCRFSE